MNTQSPPPPDTNAAPGVMRKAYRPLSDAEQKLMSDIKDAGEHLHSLIAGASATGSRELSIAKIKVEEAVMWAVKHITA